MCWCIVTHILKGCNSFSLSKGIQQVKPQINVITCNTFVGGWAFWLLDPLLISWHDVKASKTRNLYPRCCEDYRSHTYIWSSCSTMLSAFVVSFSTCGWRLVPGRPLFTYAYSVYMPILMAARFKALVCGPSFPGVVSSNPAGGHGNICLECCVLWGRGLCAGLIPLPEESYRLRRVWVCSWSLDRMEALSH